MNSITVFMENTFNLLDEFRILRSIQKIKKCIEREFRYENHIESIIEINNDY